MTFDSLEEIGIKLLAGEIFGSIDLTSSSCFERKTSCEIVVVLSLQEQSVGGKLLDCFNLEVLIGKLWIA